MNDQTPDEFDIKKNLQEAMGEHFETDEDPVLRKMRTEDGLGEVPKEYEEHFTDEGEADSEISETE